MELRRATALQLRRGGMEWDGGGGGDNQHARSKLYYVCVHGGLWGSPRGPRQSRGPDQTIWEHTQGRYRWLQLKLAPIRRRRCFGPLLNQVL